MLDKVWTDRELNGHADRRSDGQTNRIQKHFSFMFESSKNSRINA